MYTICKKEEVRSHEISVKYMICYLLRCLYLPHKFELICTSLMHLTVHIPLIHHMPKFPDFD